MRLKIFMILSVFCVGVFVHPIQTDAVAPVVARVFGETVGERVVMGMAEKAGIEFTNRIAKQKVVEKWNFVIDSKIGYYNRLGKKWESEQLKLMQEHLSAMKPDDMIPSDVNGLSKVVISSAAFLLGADVLYDVYAEYKLNADKKAFMEVMSNYDRGVSSGEYVNALSGFTFTKSYDTTNYPDGYFLNVVNLVFNPNGILGQYQIYNKAPSVYYFYKKDQGVYVYVRANYVTSTGSTYTSDNFVGSFVSGHVKTKQITVATSDYVPLRSSINPVLDSVREKDLQSLDDKLKVPDDYPSNVEIKIPTDDSFGDNDTLPKPWNDVYKKDDVVPVPPVPDNGDGGTGTGTGTGDGGDDGDGGTKDTPPKKDATPLILFTDKFPFSLPWDLFNMVNALVAEPVRPSVKVDEMFMGVHFKFSQDFAFLDEWIGFFRMLLIIGFNLFLITSTRKLLGGGQ